MAESPLVVNFWGGPGSGKSTTAYGVMYELKRASGRTGLRVEMAHEYAKEVVFYHPPLLGDQMALFAEQLHRLEILRGKVDVVVSDTALLMSLVYGRDLSEPFRRMVLHEHRSDPSLNIFVRRPAVYEAYGRRESEASARAVDDAMLKVLREYCPGYVETDCGPNVVESSLELIEQRLRVLRPELAKGGPLWDQRRP